MSGLDEQAGLVLLVEDNRQIAETVGAALERAGYSVDYAADGPGGLHLAVTGSYDVIVLDLNLPGMDGLEICRKLRGEVKKATPVLMLTARGTLEDKLIGLESGADDYLVKPFEVRELEARLRALIRRAAGHASSELVCGPLRLDTKSSKADLDGAPLKLTSHEFRLLAYLMHHMGEVVSRTELVEHLYDQDFDRDSNTIEVFVGRIRKKLGVEIIQTVRGLGYLLTPPDAR